MKILVLIITCFVLSFLFIRYLERASLFFPQKEMDFDPAQQGVVFEDIFLKTEDHLLLNGWFFKAPSAKATILFFHGNAGNMSHRLEKIFWFRDLGVNVFIIDYRGYGKSQGVPSEEGLYKDARAAFDYVSQRQDVDKKCIVGYGESLGGAVVADLALHRPLASMIVDSSFSSAADMARRYYPLIPAFLLKTRMDSAAKVKEIQLPKLFIHSKDDEIVPYALAKKLFDAAQKPKTFLEINGDHNGGYALSKERYLSGIKDFLISQGL